MSLGAKGAEKIKTSKNYKMQSEKRFTKYLKAKDADDKDQLQQGLNTMIKQEFGNQSKMEKVAKVMEAMIILDINSIPSSETLIQFFENEPNSINPKIRSGFISKCISYLETASKNKVQQEMKTPQTKLKPIFRSSEAKSKDADSDGRTESEDDNQDDDFDSVITKLKSSFYEKSPNKKQTESDAHAYQSLVKAGKKLNDDHIHALVGYHLRQEEVIQMQRNAAEIIRQSVDAEFHSFFELPHSEHAGTSTTNVLGSIYLKALVVKYYDLRPGASSRQYKKIEDIILSYGKAEKDPYFDCRKFSKDIQQARSAYEFIFDLTGGKREIIRPVEETAKQVLQHIARTEHRMIEFAINLEQEIEQSSTECNLESVMKAIVDRQGRINDAMGSARFKLLDQHSEGANGKK